MQAEAPMMREFHALTIEEVEESIDRLKAEGLLLEEMVSIAEADVLRCRFLGRRINIKIDLAYGAEIDPVDSFSSKEIDEISNLILTKL
ncbi:hypothetical protein [Variovorax boronicumulans]|uniref:hypothetical protein n=1 Tax=Variovorax boronicumulans TaxID=436515 RepID=UPI0012E5DE73|nr:hypothetical protein [Variovorax boronicumulans]GER10243.1 hypothetical protein VHAB30_13990 [Variovorax boronicumulans]